MKCLINEVIEILYSKVGMPISTKIIYKYGGFITPTAKIIKNMINIINNKNTTIDKIKTKQILVGIKPNKHKRLDYKHFNIEKFSYYLGNTLVISNYWYDCMYFINKTEVDKISTKVFSYNYRDKVYTIYNRIYLPS
jgi:hypothetical protein